MVEICDFIDGRNGRGLFAVIADIFFDPRIASVDRAWAHVAAVVLRPIADEGELNRGYAAASRG